MRKTVRRAAVLYLLVAAFIGATAFLCYEFAVNGQEWVAKKENQHIYTNGAVLNTGKITDCNGVVLAETVDGKRVFHESEDIRKAVLHVIGDAVGNISTGTQNLYRSILSGYNAIDGIYNLKKEGGNDITLNIDSEANKIAYESLGEYKGTVIVCNYKTGQLLCSVSKPSYDVYNIPSDILESSEYEGVYIDRAVSGYYTPGSIMKIITAACAIENIPDLYDMTFKCTGKYATGNGNVICNGVHGTITFEEAMNQSCNCAFAKLSIMLGSEKLLETAESLGFNQKLMAKEVPLTKSSFDPSEDLLKLGWAGIGQSTTLINPTHFLAIMNAIANGGTGYAPDRIKSLGDSSERTPQVLVSMKSTTADALKKLLRSNVIYKYGENKFPNLEMCAKTGTAENDNGKSNSVFAGFSSRDDLPLAVVVIAENGGWGSGPASDVANDVLQYFLENYTE